MAGMLTTRTKVLLLLCRFLTLVDVLYEHNIRLFCSSEGLPFELFQHIVTRSQAKEPKVMQVGISLHPAVAIFLVVDFSCRICQISDSRYQACDKKCLLLCRGARNKLFYTS